MTHEASWEDLAAELKTHQAAGPLRVDWYAYVGSENYGIWFFGMVDPATEEIRAAFGLFAARVIEKLGIQPIPIPRPLEHFPAWKLYCEVGEEIARLQGKTIDLSDAVPLGLGATDCDAVDPCTRAWLEILRRESRAFQSSGGGALTIKGVDKLYPSLGGYIPDVWAASAVYCMQRATDEIGTRLIARSAPAERAATAPAHGEANAGDDKTADTPRGDQKLTEVRWHTLSRTGDPSGLRSAAFERLARRAIVELGHRFSRPSEALDAWIGLLLKRSEHPTSSIVDSICSASAELCAELAVQSIETDNPNSEAVFRGLEQQFRELGNSGPEIWAMEIEGPIEPLVPEPLPGAANRGEMRARENSSPQVLKTEKRRGRRPNQERRNAIRSAVSKHGDQWRDHLNEIFAELDSQEVPLGDFVSIRIDLEDGQSSRISKWDDLDLAQGEQRKQIIDSLRKYAD